MQSRRNSWHNKARKKLLLSRIQSIQEELDHAQNRAETYREILEANKEEYDEYIELHPEITAFLDRPTLFSWYGMRDLEIPVDEDRAMGLTFKGEIEGNQRMPEGQVPSREEIASRLEDHFLLLRREEQAREWERKADKLERALRQAGKDYQKL